MKTLVLSVVIAMASVINTVSGNATNRFVYNSEVSEEGVKSETVFKIEDGKYLHNHLKYNYIYDKEGRISRKEVLKWNENTQTFEKHHSLNFFYTDDVTIEYASWNKKNNAYSDSKEKAVYQTGNNTLRYIGYEWNKKESNWKLKTEHDAAYWNEPLLANK